MNGLSRIGVVFQLTLKEAVRRRLLIVLVLGCILFMGSGAGCLRACSGAMSRGTENREQEVRHQMKGQGKTAAEIESVVSSLQQESQEQDKALKKNLKVGLLGFSYGLIAFWLYMIAGIFTPFLALNDFQSRTHVMLLARPLSRYEYLLGKYAAILGLLILNMGLLLGSFHAFIALSLGERGWEIWRGIPILLEGIALYVAVMMLLTLAVGRIPAIFIGIVLIVIGIVPAFYLMTSPEKVGQGTQAALIYATTYGLPQFSVNFIYGLGEVMDLPGVENFLKQGGNRVGFYSLFINAGWLAAVGGALAVLFRRQEVET